MQTIWIDAIEFKNLGGWKKDTQFVRSMGQPYLIACDKPGVPVTDASTPFTATESGNYRVFVRTKNWKLPEAPGRFEMAIDGKALTNTLGKMPTYNWYWEIAGDVTLEKGEHTLSAVDKTGWLSRFAAVVITNDMDFTPTPELPRMLKQRASIKGISHVPAEYEFDLVVVGAGPAGIPTAIEAARNGIRTALISGRPTIGGNASNEGTISMDGAASHHKGAWEGGIANEIRNLHILNGMTYEAAMELLCANEPLLTIFRGEYCIDAESENGHIISATTINIETLEKKIFRAKLFSDCTGDGWLGYYAGAAYRLGREAKWQYDEDFAPETPDTLTMSGCLCDYTEKLPKMRTFRAEKTDRICPFTAPDWAIKLPEGEDLHRRAVCLYRSEWWMENSNDFDDLWDEEHARDELIRLGLGYFHWLKNSAPLSPELAADVDYYDLCEMALHISKRESRRLMGDYVFTQSDCVKGKKFDDAISYCGWNIDVHHPRGIYSGDETEFLADTEIPLTPLPYRMIYSKNIDNLFIGGRCCSVSHLGLGTVRVESTLASLGQAAGAAAYLCLKHGTTPRGIYESHIKELQQLLLHHDLSIPYVKNEDEKDLARRATVTADSVADDVYMILTDGVSDVWCELDEPFFVTPHRIINKTPEFYRAELKCDSDTPKTVTAKLYSFDHNDIEGGMRELESRDITLPAGFDGYVDLGFETKSFEHSFAVTILPCKNVYWKKRLWSRYSLLGFTMENGKPSFIYNVSRELMYTPDHEKLADCSPENVISGENRPSVERLNGWASAKGSLPSSITLTLDQPHVISEIDVTSFVELSYPTYGYMMKTQFCGMPRDLNVSVLTGGEWVTVGSVTDNVKKQWVVRFDPVLAEAVKVTVTRAQHDDRARLTEIRIYE